MAQPTDVDDVFMTLAFSVRSNPGAYALLLGAGVSAPSGIPTAWGVLESLISQVATIVGEETSDPVAWYVSRYGQPPRYETLLETIAPTPDERQRLLKSFFEPSAEDVEAGRKVPTAAHHAIARLVRGGYVKIIITLNFDGLIEQAIRQQHMEPTVVATPAQMHGLAPLHTLQCCVIHLHGYYLYPESMLNTVSELGAYQPEAEQLLQRVLRDYGLIIAGWSATYDPALRAAVAAHYPSRYTLVWIEPKQPSTEATELRVLKNGLLLPNDADTGFGQLADAVEALEARNARHPLTVAVAVETAKRELSGRQVAISLHDRLNREFRRLNEHDDFHLRDFHSVPDGGYEAVVGRVEEATKVCSALVATISYWGNDTTDEWWTSEIERFATHVNEGGLVKLLELKRLAGTVLYYAAGVAALAGRRYGLVARLLNARYTDPYTGQTAWLAEILDADRTFAEAPGHGARVFSLLRPLLHEALAISDQALEDTWQIFEVIRLARATMTKPRFGELLTDYGETADALRTAQHAFEEENRTGAGVDEARVKRAEAWQDHMRVLGHLADLVPLRRPHILTLDSIQDNAYRSPVADRLAQDIAAEGAAHPLVEAGVATDAGALSAAVTAVSIAAGRVGRSLALAQVPPGGGVVPNKVWLDTANSPKELVAE